MWPKSVQSRVAMGNRTVGGGVVVLSDKGSPRTENAVSLSPGRPTTQGPQGSLMSLQPLHTPSPRVRGGGMAQSWQGGQPPLAQRPVEKRQLWGRREDSGLAVEGDQAPPPPRRRLTSAAQGPRSGRLRWWFAWRVKWGGAGRVEVGPARGPSPSRGTPEIQSRCPSRAGRRGGRWPAASINAPRAFPFHLGASHRPACLGSLPDVSDGGHSADSE